MSWWQALVLGVVEGLTEYLPVSSTGHLILVAWLLGLEEQDPAVFTFNIVIQAGAILAVLYLYWERIVQMLRGILGRDPAGRQLAGHLILAFLPAAILGPLLDEPIEGYLNGAWPVVFALFVGGWLMLLVEFNRARKARAAPAGSPAQGTSLEDMTWTMALLIGLGQCLAMWPGTSRSMMTIVTALLLGMRAGAAAEFSFLLGLITLSAATGYKGLKDGDTMLEQLGPLPIVVGMVASTVSAALAVKWFVYFLNRHGLTSFGWYRIVVAIALAVLLLSGLLTA